MDINTFKNLLVSSIEKYENACVYAHSSNETESVFSVYIDDTCFSLKCTVVTPKKKQILR